MKSEQVIFPCETCDYETTCEENLRSHKIDLHSKKTIDHLTEEIIEDNPSNVAEIKFKQPVEPIPETVKLFEKKKGHHEVDEITPLRSFSGELKYPCNKCEYTATAKPSLKRHLDFVHNGFKIKCDECNKLFSGYSPLRRHIKRDHKYEMKYCDLCDFHGRSTDDVRFHKSKNHFN